MSLLSKLLSKLNVESEEELSPDEKATFNKYKAILAKADVSVETIKEFCDHQIEIIHANCDGKTPLTPIQQASLHIYLNIKKAIDGPRAEREAVEQYLQQIIQS